MNDAKFWLSQVARSTPYDDTLTNLGASEVQTAIEALKAYAETIARFAVASGFDGGASSGRWLEFITNIPSNTTPFVLPRNAILGELVLAGASNATASVQVKNNGTTISTISLANQRKNKLTGLNIALTNLDEISAQVSSGSVTRPMLFMFFVFT